MKFYRRFLNIIIFAPVLLLAPLVNSAVLDPDSFASLGTLNLTSGDYTFDTTAMTLVENSAPGTVLFTGVEDNQRGQADSFGGGSTTVGASGIPYIAVFTFDNITIDGTSSITITGNRALALLSKNDIYLNEHLSVDAPLPPASGTPAAALGSPGGPGGFAGGTPGVNGGQGLGPGGGPAHPNATTPSNAASFGSVGFVNTAAAPTYGDLSQALQGGSGGASSTSFGNAGGAGGAGAIALVANGTTTVDSSGLVSARGSTWQKNGVATGGSGSAGGIIVTGNELVLNGSLDASYNSPTPPGGSFIGGAGRVLVGGLDNYVVGTTPTTPASAASVSVVGPSNDGWLTIEPRNTFVPFGQTLELGNATVELQAPTLSDIGIEVVPGNLSVGGEITVPTGGISYNASIALTGPLGSSIVNGSDTLTIDSSLSGTGTVNVPVVVSTGGTLNMIADRLTFPGDGVANDDGLVNLGEMNLINSEINGDVRSPVGSVINVAGTATFNGLFSGAGTFSGTSNLITFNGGYSPGDSPAAISFGGDVSLTSGNTLLMEIFGNVAGSGYDQLTVAGNLAIGGVIDLFVDPLLTLNAGDTFSLLGWNTVAGQFASVLGIQQANDLDIAIRYNAGDMVAKVVPRGDVNDDGIVNGDDLSVIAANAGLATTSYFSGDVNGDGLVDNSTGPGSDRSLVEAAILSAGAQTVPLPFWMPLFLLALAAMAYRLKSGVYR